MSEREPTKILIGVFGEGMPTHLFIPKGALAPAERFLDAERAQRVAAANKSRVEAMRAAKARGKLRRALKACFRSAI